VTTAAAATWPFVPFDIGLPFSAGSAAEACGRPARYVVRSSLQCLHLPATGWIKPPHSGQGTRASAIPGGRAAAM
jgi:hypothetical protein